MLSLGAAERELVARIVASGAGDERGARLSSWRGRRASVVPDPPRHRARRGLAVVIAAVALAVVVFTLAPSGEREVGPAPAFAAPLVRFANASPLVLLDLPGWHIVYADETVGGYGEMHFVRGSATADGTPVGASYRDTASLSGRVASLTWSPATPEARQQIARGHQVAPTGLAVNAPRWTAEGRGRGWIDTTAAFLVHGRVLSFEATTVDVAAFRRELHGLRAVDVTTWLRAMPRSVVQAADSGAAVRTMLRGIPLPPGFDAARIRGVDLAVHDRYQLGTAVTGTVACLWIRDWSLARATGDRPEVVRAIAAMATAPRWPILREMARTGAWPQVLIGYARAMPRGTWYGRPLVGDVQSGLGCTNSWGVALGSATK